MYYKCDYRVNGPLDLGRLSLTISIDSHPLLLAGHYSYCGGASLAGQLGRHCIYPRECRALSSSRDRGDGDGGGG